MLFSRYRRESVHTQPPLIDGSGQTHKRGNPWISSPAGEHTLKLPGGSLPDYKIEEVQEAIENSLKLCIQLLEFSLDKFETILAENEHRIMGFEPNEDPIK
jgi:hypothetical protein